MDYVLFVTLASYNIRVIIAVLAYVNDNIKIWSWKVVRLI